jgi:pimeloyl-ACP methyl ester carboxylesterase
VPLLDTKLDSMLPPNIRSSFCKNNNGLDMHYLEAGYENPNNPLIVLLHGFPELAFSWRHVILPLAKSGYHVVAPDQRGFGKTTGWDNTYTSDLSSFHHINLVRDVLGLVSSLGYKSVECIVGHDSGSAVAGWSALIRPDIFKSVVMMSAPYTGVQEILFDTVNNDNQIVIDNNIKSHTVSIDDELSSLVRPRKHYHEYYRTAQANSDIMDSPYGLEAFIRGYYHYKSADWSLNSPFPLKSFTASELEKMPTYYIMDLHDNMADTVAKEMPTDAESMNCEWLTDKEIEVYSEEYGRTGFQGGLNWYRASVDPGNQRSLELFSGVRIKIPSLFVAGKQDWGPQQKPGSLLRMRNDVSPTMKDMIFIDNAGHWVQQEQPEKVTSAILEFISINVTD